ncbi:MAG: hypothetical protein AB1351_05730 [Thermoproteota archaeon]
MVYGSLLPVIAGLAIGITFVVVFSIFAGSAFGGSASEKIRRIAVEISYLKDAHQVGEPVSFIEKTAEDHTSFNWWMR